MSIRCRDSNKAVIIEALRRARYKFPGRQKIIVSKKWGFTSLDRADYEALKRDKQVINDGAYVQVSWTGIGQMLVDTDALAVSSSSQRASSWKTSELPPVLRREVEDMWGCCTPGRVEHACLIRDRGLRVPNTSNLASVSIFCIVLYWVASYSRPIQLHSSLVYSLYIFKPIWGARHHQRPTFQHECNDFIQTGSYAISTLYPTSTSTSP